jgi:hypothetical protein
VSSTPAPVAGAERGDRSLNPAQMIAEGMDSDTAGVVRPERLLDAALGRGPGGHPRRTGRAGPAQRGRGRNFSGRR